MGSRIEKHLSRLAMPKSWKIKRKGIKWIARPLPGAHSLEAGMPLVVLLRDILHLAKTSKEAKIMLNTQEILVDGARRKEQKFIVGFMDIVSIPKIKGYFRILFDKKGYLVAEGIKEDEASVKLCRIIGKTAVKKGRIQLNLYDGKNIIIDKDSYKVGDTVTIELPSQKIKAHLKLEKGAAIILTKGKHAGEIGIVEGIKGKMISYKRGNKESETLKDYAYVIGKEKPSIKIE